MKSEHPALSALLALFIVNLVLQPLTEPDFGWHLRAGLDLVASGWRMPATDPYSYTVPDWPWVEHAWLTDALLGVLAGGLEPIGLTVIILLFGLITASAFLLSASLARVTWTARMAAVVAALWAALPFLGARTQMVTLLGLSCLLWLWQRSSDDPRAVWLFPPLMWLWANLHGGFTAGLFTLAVLIAGAAMGHAIRTRLAWRSDETIPSWRRLGGWTAAWVVGAALTLVNPYGLDLHREIAASLSDRDMLEVLHEWQAPSLDEPAGRTYALYLAAAAISLVLWYRRVESVRWIVALVFLALSLRHWRNVPLFLLVSQPIAAAAIDGGLSRLADRLRTDRRRRVAGLGLAAAAAALALVLGASHLQDVARSGLDPRTYFRHGSYPMAAIEWVRDHGAPGSRLFHDYGWGGFLLWWLPDQKVFIDGRMPAWRIGGRSLLRDYVAAAEVSPPDLTVLDRYRVDWALLSRGRPLVDALATDPGWQPLYRDDVAVIYRRAAVP